MRSDPSQSDAFKSSKSFDSPLLDFKISVPQPKSLGPAYRSNSFSGKERNRLLLAQEDGFFDASLISGVDCREDARSFAVLDYDRDGWLDIALVSVNAQRFRLFRNCLGELGNSGRMLEIRLIGGNKTSKVSKLSNRDAIGASVSVVTSRGKRLYRNSAGEGLSSQNASSIRVTLGDGEELKSLEVLWPSGEKTMLNSIPSEPLLEIEEASPETQN